MERTTFGKRVYAVGSNRTVAILSGIRAGRPKTQYLMIVGFTASLVGVVSVSRLGVIIIALTRNFLNLARIESLLARLRDRRDDSRRRSARSACNAASPTGAEIVVHIT